MVSFSAELIPASTRGYGGERTTWRPGEQTLNLKNLFQEPFSEKRFSLFRCFQLQAIQFQASGIEKEASNQCLRVLIVERNLRRFETGCASNTVLVNLWSLNKSTTAWLLMGQISNSSRLRSVLGFLQFVKHWTFCQLPKPVDFKIIWPMRLCLKIREKPWKTWWFLPNKQLRAGFSGSAAANPSGPKNAIQVGVPLQLNLPNNLSIEHAPKPVCRCKLPNKSSWQKLLINDHVEA